jgi:hypothetical protein
MSRKRFDARFFVALVPAGQKPVHDDHEAIESVWLEPKVALGQYWNREIQLAPPQIMSLTHLAQYQTAERVIADARSRPPPCIQPEAVLEGGMRILTFPGDDGHPERVRAAPGPTRLYWRNDRYEPDGGLRVLLSVKP